ncbi:GNAT family N-acetyltransferase [Halovenus sp. WSH3]|uniref:GNAT family N-acetyltransferase n=1 Tax=Halovenus carboxidivorans TaxID=2692199 RepID=A0A6B0T4P6_9EURY|nr:GNAT family N-acetyltransferase [Halovenus carboxidivorans]MXR53105.1 GNAT family N-acetyltransferase [Halovenus carboxidivorans]
MDSDVTIRAAEQGDAEAILHIHVGAIIADGPGAYSDRQVAAWAAKTEGTQRYLDSVDDEATDIVVAEREGVTGFGELDTDDGVIEAIFVEPQSHGTGIGSTILRHFEQTLRRAGFSRSRLRAVHNAVGFYERHGYEPTGTDTRTTTNGVELSSVWMEKHLSDR